jgi:hypothetical protein
VRVQRKKQASCSNQNAKCTPAEPKTSAT